MFFYLGLCLCWSENAPHLIERIHVEGQVILFAFVMGNRRIGIAIEGDDGINEIPHSLIVGVEDVGAILMDMDALDILAIDISTQMRTLVDDQTALTLLFGQMGERATIQASSNYQIIVRLHSFLSINLVKIQLMTRVVSNYGLEGVVVNQRHTIERQGNLLLEGL